MLLSLEHHSPEPVGLQASKDDSDLSFDPRKEEPQCDCMCLAEPHPQDARKKGETRQTLNMASDGNLLQQDTRPSVSVPTVGLYTLSLGGLGETGWLPHSCPLSLKVNKKVVGKKQCRIYSGR